MAGWCGPRLIVITSVSGSSSTVAPGHLPLDLGDRLLGGAHSYHPGLSTSLWVKRTGSPPMGKSRRCGQPT